MASTINTNIASMNAQRSLSSSQNLLSTTMARLSSGLRVNSAKDDAAGMSIATRMTAQIRGMNVALRNANDGISLAQTAEGALGKSADLLQRMRELGLQATNATNSADDKNALDAEFGELTKELHRIFTATTFNGRKILSTDSGAQVFHVGPNTATENRLTITTINMNTIGDIVNIAGSDGSLEGSTPRQALTANSNLILQWINRIDTAIERVSTQRSNLGAFQNRFENAISFLQISNENQTAARSTILDADYAQETANLSRAQILSQAGSAMVAQANQMPQSVLSLLRA